jgi:pimeloyl-ACP methyl ester carboxylesterase
MSDDSYNDFSHLDRPEVLLNLFHPRPEYEPLEKILNAVDVMIPVDDSVALAGRFHMTDALAPNILFFHGNGEIVSDYDDLGPFYNNMGINFLAVDYRGYGRSTGSPTVAFMMRDSHKVFEFTEKWLKNNNCKGAFIVMGRSLGSASALETANRYMERIDGLIIESGFAHTGPLLQLLGLNLTAMGFTEEKGMRNLDKIRTWAKPTLIIHAEFDQLISISEGRALYEACPSQLKTFLKISNAGHNDIFMKDQDTYIKAIKSLCKLLEG